MTFEPTIGRWLWILEDTRRETKMALTNIDQSVLDWTPSQAENSIGTLLYHIGLIELDLGTAPLQISFAAVKKNTAQNERYLLGIFNCCYIKECTPTTLATVTENIY